MNKIGFLTALALFGTSLQIAANIEVRNQTDQKIQLIISKHESLSPEIIKAQIEKKGCVEVKDDPLTVLIEPWQDKRIILSEKGHYNVNTSCYGARAILGGQAYIDGTSTTVYTFDMKEDWTEVDPRKYPRFYIPKQTSGQVYLRIESKKN